MVLSDLNTSVHKSVNQFLINAADAYIKKLKGHELTNEETLQPDDCFYITREDLNKIQKEIKEDLQREMIILLGTIFTNGKIVQIPEIKTEGNSDQKDVEEDMNADETTIDLASSWG